MNDITPSGKTNELNCSHAVDCVVFGYEEGKLKVLLLESDLPQYKGQWALPGDGLRADEDLNEACCRILKQQIGLSNLFIEQVRTFGAVDRHPLGRIITTAYFSLVNLKDHQLKIQENVLRWEAVAEVNKLALDHDLILGTSFSALKRRVQEEPIIFNLLQKKFSLRDLKLVYEQILGVAFDRRNFRKKFFANNLLRDENEMESNVKHRPGKLYSFDFKAYEQMGKKSIFLL